MRAGFVAAAVAIALTGCASVSDEVRDRSLAALGTPEPERPKELPTGKPAAACLDDPYTSLRPRGRLPRPGRMPARSFMREIQRRGYLRAGVDQNSLGLSYFDAASGRMEGFDIDVVRAIARAIFGRGDPDDHIRYTAISTPQRIAAVVYDNVDLVASALTNTCERQTLVRFSSVYHRAITRLLVPEDSDVDSLDDLRGKPVCATSTSTTIKSLEGTGVVPYPAELRTDCLVALQERDVAAVSADDTILLGLCRQDPQTKIVGPMRAKYLQPYGLAIRRDRTDFVRFVNGVLARTDVDALREHWLGALGDRPDHVIRRCEIPGT